MNWTQSEVKDLWKNASRRHFYIKCKKCGRFVEITREEQGEKLLEVNLYCSNCNHEVTIQGCKFSYKWINRSKNFQAIFIESHDSIELWKNSVYPIHSTEI